MTGLAFKRMYVDIPPDTKEKLEKLAAQKGMSQKGLVALLIENACEQKRKPATRSKKRGTKKKANRRK